MTTPTTPAPSEPKAATALRHKDLLGIADLTPEEIQLILNTAEAMKEIGLRTTKLRRLDDTLVTIPNAEMAQIRIENVTRRRKSLFNPRLGLRYETTGAQIKVIQDAILAMLADHPKVVTEGARVRFTSFGDYTLNLDVFAYVEESRLPDFVLVQEELNLRVMEIVLAAGAAFAFPSQTNYLARDSLPGSCPARRAGFSPAIARRAAPPLKASAIPLNSQSGATSNASPGACW